MNNVTIYHNPACGTSRTALALIRQRGVEPEIVLYLKTPPSAERLKQLTGELDGGVRALLRDKEELYRQLGLAQEHWSDDQLLEFMLAHPILINRPLVVTPLGTRLCRPAERVLEILPDGQQDAAGNR